jgi:hypothetical protein
MAINMQPLTDALTGLKEQFKRPLKVYVLIIKHRHGMNISVHETDPSPLIALYFEKIAEFAGGESWMVDECEVQP